MTETEMYHRIGKKLQRMKNGEIRLIVRNGEVKYVNVLEEYVPDPPQDRGKNSRSSEES